MGAATTLFLVNLAITATAATYQITEQRKMEKKAKRAADARKGFELVHEGSISSIPLVYGKALIGGIRVYHNTAGSFKYTQPNSDAQFLTGQGAASGGNFNLIEDYTPDGVPIEANYIYDSIEDGTLSKSIAGNVNEFLFYQQAICIGNINAIYEVVVDDLYIDDTILGTRPGVTNLDDNKSKAALRVDAHYDGKVDNIFALNFPDRRNAKFTDMAYANGCFRLDRDNPQFNTIPDAVFILEGKKVREVLLGALSPSWVYSNNPAWCLLDYLLDSTVGKGLSTFEIDLPSFEAAALLCNKIVYPNAPVGGKLYKPTDGSRNISTRDIPLYECNIVISTEVSIRENIEAILATMGDARLVWVAGQYRLVLQYPESNAEINVAQIITDDELIPDDNFEVSWPSSQERLNHCTVKFHNETENFKEDTVSWPPKVSKTEKRGTGGKYYNAAGGWSSSRTSGQFLNAFAVWNGTSADTAAMTWKITADTTGIHTLKYLFDDLGSIAIYDSSNVLVKSISQGAFNTSMSPASTTVSLVADSIYRIEINATNTNFSGKNLRGAAASLTSTLNIEIWSTRSVAFDSIQTVTVADAVYQTMLLEDNEVPLETELFMEGTTDYYHALAKAEEIVRTSRSATKFKFKYIVKNKPGQTVKFLVPGDIIRLESQSLSLGVSSDLFIKIDNVKLVEGLICEVTGQRFDYSQLAWNVADDEYFLPERLYKFDLVGPESLTHSAVDPNNSIKNSSGTLSWPSVSHPKLSGYIIYIHTEGQLTSEGRPLFTEVGRTSNTSFYLPQLNAFSAYFGVRSYSGNLMSEMTVTAGYIELHIKDKRRVDLKSSDIAFIQSANSTAYLNPTILLTAATENYIVPEFKWYREDIAVPLVQSGASDTLSIEAFPPGTFRVYRVEVEDLAYPSEITKLIDKFSVYSVKEGSDVFNIVVSNEYILLNANSEGEVISGLLPVEIAAYAFKGIVEQTTGVTYSLSELVNVVASINSATGVTTITAVSGVAGTLKITATKSGETASKVLRIVKVLAGTTAPSLELSVTGPGFIFKDPTSLLSDSPSIKITADIKNSTGTANFTATAYDANDTVVALLSITPAGNELILSVADFVQNGAQTTYVVIEATLNGLSDSTTIYRGNDGTDSVIFFLSNENHTVPASSTGAAESLIGASTNLIIYQGVVATTSSWSFSKVDSGLISSLDVSNTSVPVVSIVDFPEANNSGYVDITATRAGYPTQTKRFTLSKSKEGATGQPGSNGANGTNARAVSLDLSSQVVSYNTSGQAPNITAITATATPRNTVGTVYYEFFRNNVSLGVATTLNTKTIATSSTYALATIPVEVRVREDSASGAILATDKVSIFGVRAGADSVSAILSNEAHTISAEADGTPLSFTGSGTSLKVYVGATPLVFDGSLTGFPTVGRFRVVRAASGVTPGGTSGVNTTKADFAGISSMPSVSGSISYTINAVTSEGVQATITKEQTFSKSLRGDSGGPGSPGSAVKSTTGYLFYQYHSAEIPTGANSFPAYDANPYNYTTGAFTLTNSFAWKVSPPQAVGGGRYWYRVFTVSQVDTGSQTVTIGGLLEGHNFSGLVTFTSISEPQATTFIDGSNIKTGTLTLDRLKAGAVNIAAGYDFSMGVGSGMGLNKSVVITKGGNDGVSDIHGAIHISKGAALGLAAGHWGPGTGPAAYFASASDEAFTSLTREVNMCNASYAIEVLRGDVKFSNNLQVNGEITGHFSDARLKDVSGKITGALDKVMQLNGYYYTPNEIALGMGHDFRKNVGCLTQEVEKVLPEVIRDYDSEYKTMKYELLVPLLIEAIKELKLEIEEIKNAPTNFR